MTAAVEARGLRKQYGDVDALAGVDLEIRAGEVFALLGPNGAGKTTAVEILEGYRSRSGGDVRVLGADPQRGGAEWRARIGIVLQTPGTFAELTVREVVDHFAEFYPHPLAVDRVLEMVGLSERQHVRCGQLSGGQRRRVDLALGVVGDPQLLFLDEPTTGFDPAARRQAWEVVRELTALGATVLLTTHYLDEAEALADRVAVIAQGRILEVGTPEALGGRSQARARVSFRLRDGLAAQALPPVARGARERGGRLSFETAAPTRAVAELTAWAQASGVDELPELAVTRPSLEEVYLHMVAPPAREGSAA